MQERARATRQRILSTAAEIFDTSGFAATAVSSIAELSEVSKGAMHFHFPSKASLAHEMIRQWSSAAALTDTSVQAHGMHGPAAVLAFCRRATGVLGTDAVVRVGLRLSL
ncbi:TetR family transcriptional regulator [Rhodococcus erythropolis]